MIINMKQKIERTNDVIVTNMGQEKVMLSVTNEKYYNLGELGGDIWERIKNPKTINQLILELTKDYEIDHVQCEQDVLPFLQHLLKEKLIMVS